MEGIENIEFKDIEIANQLNFRIKLLGITELVNNKLFERVHPMSCKKRFLYCKCFRCNERCYFTRRTSWRECFAR